MSDNSGGMAPNDQYDHQIDSKSTTGILDTEQLTFFMSQVKFQLKIFAETRKQMNVFMAQDFSVFKYIQPDENRLSDILADLLNPQGDHGQGQLFLDKFLDFIQLPENVRSQLSDNDVSVSREKATDLLLSSQRRIDIFLRFSPSRFMIGIENKPGAADQQGQLSDYAEYLSRASRDKFLLVYVPEYYKEPHSKSLDTDKAIKLKEQGQFVIFPYRNDLLNWLILSRRGCEAERVRNFIQDLIGYIEKEFQFNIQAEGAK